MSPDYFLPGFEGFEQQGLEACAPPKPLPPIEPDEIHLICWMGIATHESTTNE
jgi:hypothetical protein|tara:strand:- start:263 stop:421 length:159 start_codon:yes stop_codon:yes gene_type:complete